MIKKLIIFFAFLTFLNSNAWAATNYNERLLIATVNNNMRQVEQAVINGANVDYNPDYRLTPLINAVKNKRYQIAEYLLDHGANPNLAATNGASLDTPLLYAVYNNDIKMAELLLERGADPNQPKVLQVDIVVDLPRRPGHQPGQGKYPLKYQITLAPQVIAKDATPLIYAVQKENTDNPSLEMVNLLLNYGADASKASFYGYTPLMAASDLKTGAQSRKQIRVRIAQLLLSYGANPLATDQFGNTALDYAETRKFREMSELLN